MIHKSPGVTDLVGAMQTQTHKLTNHIAALNPFAPPFPPWSWSSYRKSAPDGCKYCIAYRCPRCRSRRRTTTTTIECQGKTAPHFTPHSLPSFRKTPFFPSFRMNQKRNKYNACLYKYKLININNLLP